MARVFATTWNMGGVSAGDLRASLPTMVDKWLPHDCDLYVIGVQECECLKELISQVHEHLGGPDAYTAFHRELGDTRVLHGAIAVALFARTDDAESGVFKIHRGAVDKVAAGVNLGPMGRAANKGMVGIAARYHDCSLALITAHFASDLKGRNRVAKRNQDACTTLRDLSLSWDTEQYDVHTQHHHAILLGDLNYRLRASPDEVLSMVATSARAEGDQWREGRRQKLFSAAQERSTGSLGASTSSLASMPPSWSLDTTTGGVGGALAAGATCSVGGAFRGAPSTPGPWAWVRNYEELTQSMASHRVFWGFKEGEITFPPSYRWRRGGEGGDFADPVHLKGKAYTTSTHDADIGVEDVSGEGGGVVDKADEGEACSSSSWAYDGVVAGVNGQTSIHDVRPPSPTSIAPPSVDPSSVRTPSYTDRVLVHSLPGCEGRLVVRQYDMADAVTLSDHRPVAAAIELQVDRAVKGFKDDTWRDDDGGDGLQMPSLLRTLSLSRQRFTGSKDDLVAFSIKLDAPVLDVYATRTFSPREVSLLFPLISEDPLALQRQAENLSQVFHLDQAALSSHGRQLLRHDTSVLDVASIKPANRYVSWSAFPVRHRTTASLRFSEHMLLKVNDGHGYSLGQGVVLVRELINKGVQRIRVPLASGGTLQGMLHVDVRVNYSRLRR